MTDNFKKNLDLGINGNTTGGEEHRQNIVEVSQIMYDKIKFFEKDDREAILDIMRALSNASCNM